MHTSHSNTQYKNESHKMTAIMHICGY